MGIKFKRRGIAMDETKDILFDRDIGFNYFFK